MDLKGKNVVYIGGFGGIGFATCKLLVKKNVSNLTIFDVVENPAHLDELISMNPGTKVMFMQLDLSDKDQIIKVVKDVIANMDYIDILVNGSGILNERDPEITISVNLLGVIHTILNVIPHMDKANGGRGGLIVAIASIMGLEPGPITAIYTASKHGIIGFTRSISDEYYYERSGIAIITICPGITTTDIWNRNSGGTHTFPHSKSLSTRYRGAKTQSADDCAVNLVKIMETGKNGSIWILDIGKMEEVQPHKYWDVTF